MCRHIYNWNIIACDVKQPFSFTHSQLLPFAKILFSQLFFVMFRDIDLNIHVWICLDVKQV